ncbi:chemotaxis protein CheW [Sphingomonas sp. IC081]|uniref:chemotaxis protein CheW n=1 Tax=Sphingomonas sp. IC081 TaxID=304378 RepID=UPI001156DD92|nr:chemotaxis protein CheW [Sphingomonas sp. IC081]QDK34035.1 chemotaxis protein CheW [Sphingomonas sp. IC081]
MSERSTTEWDASGQLEVLTFDIGDERLAIEAVSIREILDLLPETRVPGAAALVASVVNFRGKIIPIADLRVAFGMPIQEATADNRIVVIETELDGEATQIGLRTDKVHEVTILERSRSSEPPVLGMRWRRQYVRELVRLAEEVVVIPDLANIFGAIPGTMPGATTSTLQH